MSRNGSLILEMKQPRAEIIKLQQGFLIFRNEIEALSRDHPDQLRVVHTLTRETRKPTVYSDVRTGRVRLDLLKEVVPSDLNCHFFVCGPAVSSFERAVARERGVEPAPRFLESVLTDLKALGVRNDQITRESYGRQPRSFQASGMRQ